MGIRFTKMQGCGNDFVILEYDEFKKINMDMSNLAKKLCDRHFGVGADGLIIPDTNVKNTDIGWYFYNSDGTTAQMCGNGMRCFAKYVYDKKIVQKQEFSVATLAGIITPKILDNGKIRVNMSKPILDNSKIPFIPKTADYTISVKDRLFKGYAISMGNPHFVIYVEESENLLELAETYGSIIECLDEFPEKTNVEFVKCHNDNYIEFCVWERGCGITLACGTGACACVVAGILNNYIKNPVTVKLLGGELEVEWEGDKNNIEKDVFLTGPAEYVFEAQYNI